MRHDIIRDKDAPHQIDIRFDSNGNIVSGCNCGEEFDRAKTADANLIRYWYQKHMDQISKTESDKGPWATDGA